MAIQVRTKNHNLIHILHKYQKYGLHISKKERKKKEPPDVLLNHSNDYENNAISVVLKY